MRRYLPCSPGKLSAQKLMQFLTKFRQPYAVRACSTSLPLSGFGFRPGVPANKGGPNIEPDPRKWAANLAASLCPIADSNIRSFSVHTQSSQSFSPTPNEEEEYSNTNTPTSLLLTTLNTLNHLSWQSHGGSQFFKPCRSHGEVQIAVIVRPSKQDLLLLTAIAPPPWSPFHLLSSPPPSSLSPDQTTDHLSWVSCAQL